MQCRIKFARITQNVHGLAISCNRGFPFEVMLKMSLTLKILEISSPTDGNIYTILMLKCNKYICYHKNWHSYILFFWNKGSKAGVQARICEEEPTVLYIHCAGISF